MVAVSQYTKDVIIEAAAKLDAALGTHYSGEFLNRLQVKDRRVGYMALEGIFQRLSIH